MSIATSICDIKLDSCIMNASGCWCTSQNELDELNNSDSGAIVSKSGTIHSRIGNPEPRFYSNQCGSINSMGLPNLGYNFYLEYGKELINKPFIQSIHPFNLNELSIMIYDINANNANNANNIKKLVEINIACPNIINDSNEHNFEHFEKHMDKINQSEHDNIICGLKLSPLYELNHFDTMSRLLLKYNISFITCINSMANGLIIDPFTETTRIFPKGGIGGIGGNYMKPTALSNVYNFSQRLENKIDILGCGGISNGIDVFEHILCGAKAVQVGTHLMNKTPTCFTTLNAELKQLMKIKGYNTLDNFHKKIKVIDAN